MCPRPCRLKQSPGPTDLLAIRMVGVNCAACHVGRLRYKNKDLPIIEGAPNPFNIDSFYQELFQSAADTVLKQDKLEDLLERPWETGRKERTLEDPGDVFRANQEEPIPGQPYDREDDHHTGRSTARRCGPPGSAKRRHDSRQGRRLPEIRPTEAGRGTAEPVP